MDNDQYLEQLKVTNPLREPTLRSAIRALKLPPGSHGLDAGCGIGSQVLLLAEAVGPEGHVTGLDINPKFLEYAKQEAEKAGLSRRVSFRQGDIHRLPFDDHIFDWLWSADCAGYPARNPLSLVKELARVVKVGGSVNLLFWSYQMLLPGYPRLEARLNATASGIAPFTTGMKPASHYFRALGWFRDNGLEDTSVQTFAGSFQAPLNEKILCALISLLQMRWPGAESDLLPRDRDLYRRLCQPDSPDFILNLPDYYTFFTYSLFQGKVAR
jgi:ubiquinone/menaquinone biosynthesis C-methylase UbiE